MNLLLDDVLRLHREASERLEAANERLQKAMPRVIVINHEEDTAYGWVFFHPETDSIIDIRFHDEPKPTIDFSKAF